jgi:dCMP deaminase
MRPNKDDYFMSLAKLVSSRSLDPDTQHGCVAVSKDGAILSTGYNGPPRNVDDTKIPLTRPEKYLYFEHSERNCIYNAARIGIPLAGCTFYVTGIPCVDCMRAIYQTGASEVVMLSVRSHSTNNDCYEFIKFIENYIAIRYM